MSRLVISAGFALGFGDGQSQHSFQQLPEALSPTGIDNAYAVPSPEGARFEGGGPRRPGEPLWIPLGPQIPTRLLLKLGDTSPGFP
jgi:hypothetical protein